MHAHRIEVLHVADGDARVRAVAHDLVLDLLPSEERSLDEHLPDRRSRHTAHHANRELRGVVRDATAGAAEGEGGPDDERITDARRECECLLDRVRGDRFRNGLADRKKELLEGLAIFSLLDGRKGRAQETHAIPLQDT